MSRFSLAALGRVDTPETRRVPFNLVIDEAGNFTTEAFASVLAEARKYALSLTLAIQHLNQLRPVVRDAMIGNAGSLVCFRIGAGDASFLTREFAPYSAQALVELARYEICAKLLSSGEVGDPFLALTLPPLGKGYGRRDNIVAQSRQRYGRSRKAVEDKIRRWSLRRFRLSERTRRRLAQERRAPSVHKKSP
ncbi:MAG: TraM recognition domain-containing protein, partial [Proteobacteria bacterium]|nr:TraM recognition domain-containing protein [Pseudomonadota bacterium]